MEYSVRHTVFDDIEDVLAIYDSARKRMREAGNTTQWVNGYPSLDTITNDIRNGCSYVIEKDNLIVGVFVFIIGKDPTYDIIEGEWLNDDPYGTIHRIAGAPGMSGIADCCLDFCKSKGMDIRIDTHNNNAPMLGWITKRCFTYCGIIHVADGTPRLAFQLTAKIHSLD